MSRLPLIACVCVIGACRGGEADPLDFAAARARTVGSAVTTKDPAPASKPTASSSSSASSTSSLGHRQKAIEFVQKKTLIPPSHSSPVGTNLSEVSEYATERPFADAFRQSRGWISTDGVAWDDGRSVSVDARGWVKSLASGQRARALVYWADDLSFPAGLYQVSWEGTGTLDFWPQGGQSTSSKKGSYALQADPKNGGIAVTIVATDPTDPIRNIRVLIPGATPGSPFNPAFVDKLKGYGTLRFMDWLQTNRSTVVTPSDRPTPHDARFTTKGVAVELIFELCNVAGADCWINVGHTWDDALVEEVAAIAKRTLQPQRRLYVEFSNEVWNGMFPQADVARKRSVLSGFSDDAFEAQMRWHARRTTQVHAIFDKVYGVDNARVVRVLGGWAANAWSSGVMLDQVKKDGAVVDALAIAPYFGNSFGEPEQRGIVQGMALKELMSALEGAVDESLQWVAEQKKIADDFSVQLIAYEGGQHLVGVGPVADDPIVNRLFDAANESPRMKELYLRALKGWKDAGGGVFVHFTSVMRPSRYGRWGALSSMEQSRALAPKYDALMTFIETTPRWF
jgi:hypothetical protein